MVEKTKIWKTSIILVISTTFLMMAAASVNAEETEEPIPRSNETPVEDSTNNELTDDLLISPGPEPILIEPSPDVIYQNIPMDEGTTDDFVISPNQEPSSIEPYSDTINEKTGEIAEKKETSQTLILSIATIAIIAGMVISLIILKIKK